MSAPVSFHEPGSFLILEEESNEDGAKLESDKSSVHFDRYIFNINIFSSALRERDYLPGRQDDDRVFQSRAIEGRERSTYSTNGGREK